MNDWDERVLLNSLYDETSEFELFNLEDQIDDVQTRDVNELRINDLVPTQRSHARRKTIIIDGASVSETLRQRLNRETKELRTAITSITQQLARRESQLLHLQRYPSDDPCVNGEILRFKKNFPDSDKKYSYVATKIDNLWYVTGRQSPQGVTWTDLTDWMGLGVETVYRVSDGRKIIG